ncbi:MAG: GCN5-related N-acetyltransferase [Alphaproteobacteria bacterium]|jgi:ribosomal-protein-alanine N-acetyltransferase|nr:GCN5-related N-acetyltransferase [Alphaproteobacteria bacterium]
MTAQPSVISAFGGLELADAEALHRACFAAAWDRPWSRQSFAEMLAMPGTFGLMARDEANAVLGLIVVRATADEAEILTIAVEAQQRRQGIGAALIAAAQSEARGRGVVRLHLEVAEDNFAARRLYTGLGFEPVGRRGNYYARGSLGTVAAILMARPV